MHQSLPNHLPRKRNTHSGHGASIYDKVKIPSDTHPLHTVHGRYVYTHCLKRGCPLLVYPSLTGFGPKKNKHVNSHSQVPSPPSAHRPFRRLVCCCPPPHHRQSWPSQTLPSCSLKLRLLDLLELRYRRSSDGFVQVGCTVRSPEQNDPSKPMTSAPLF